MQMPLKGKRRGARHLMVLGLGLCSFLPTGLWAQCPAYAGSNASTQPGPTNDWVRVNQVGYPTTDPKIAIAFSNSSLSGLTFSIVRVSDSAVVFGPAAFPASSGAYSPFSNTYKLDFSAFQPVGTDTYRVHLSDGYNSVNFKIGPCLYQGTEETALNFYLVERCGTDNQYAGAACHLAPGSGSSRMDGKVADGPHAGTLLDTEGGWHDSGDYIKFMITTGWSCGMLLTAYRDDPGVFTDDKLANGTAGSDGLPDVLNEAKYALDWIIKMNPDASTLYYQVGGQEDHNLGLGTLPQNDTSAYSTSPYRPVYEGTHSGGSNNCGRAAACLAMAYQIWNARGDTTYANTCLTHATQLYTLGKAAAYNQPANPASFYTEGGYQADMEWAAAELYRATGTASYLTDAMTYANAAGSGGGALDWSTCNFIAHYSLYPLVSVANQTTLKGYMQSDVQSFQTQYAANVYGMNTGYNWGSMETLTGGILEGQLYDKLFGVTTYAAMVSANRDYLLGKNPWGVCFIVGLGTVNAHHPQHNIIVNKCIDVPGTPIEGPDTATDYAGQGIGLSGPDAYAAFQGTGSAGVYHDDIQDYATNEPTSTHAGLCVYAFANMAAGGSCALTPSPTATIGISPTPTPSAIPTRTATASSTPTSTPSSSMTATPSLTVTRTPTATWTDSTTATPSPSATASSTPTASSTSSWTLTASPSATPTKTVTTTSTPSSTATRTNTATSTNTSVNTATLTPTSTVTKTFTSTETLTVTSTFTNTAIITPTSTSTATRTNTPSSTSTFTFTSTATLTNTLVNTATSTLSSTATRTNTATFTNTVVNTATSTQTLTATKTFTSTSTPTSTFSAISSMSATPTITASRTSTSTGTPTSTFTNTPVLTSTATPSRTWTSSSTLTATMTETWTPSPSPTPSLTFTGTPSFTPTGTSTPTLTRTLSATPTFGPHPVLYPNPYDPSSGKPLALQVALSESGEVRVKLFTAAFRMVWREEFLNEPMGNDRLDLNLPPLANGLYYLMIEADGRRWTLKLMVLD